MSVKTPINHIKIDVPETLAPLTGYVVVYDILPHDKFHEFWTLNVAQQEEAKNEESPLHGRHPNINTYATRVPLIVEHHIYLGDEKIELPQDPDKLRYTTIAPFVVAATQKSYLKAVSIPNLSAPSKKLKKPTA
jgi:hypothetical protein